MRAGFSGPDKVNPVGPVPVPGDRRPHPEKRDTDDDAEKPRQKPPRSDPGAGRGTKVDEDA